MGEVKISYSGLDKVEEIKPDVYADTLRGDTDTRKKINEVIKVVNRMVDILNDSLIDLNNNIPTRENLC